MPGKAGGSGGSAGGSPAVQTPAGTFSATASTSGTSYFGLDGGFLTELSIRVNGDLVQAATTGGPVKIEAWLRRGPIYRHLCRGIVQNEMSVKGSGQLPIQSGSEIMVRWTNLTATAVIVKVDAFVDTEARGDSAPGWIDETPRPIGYLYSARRVCTQNNAGGGLLLVRIASPANTTMKLISCEITGPATNTTLVCQRYDEDANVANVYASVAAGVSRVWNGPTISGSASSHNVAADSTTALFGPGEYLIFACGAAAQTETLTIAISLLMSDAAAPTWDTTGSAGTAALAASTISDANTWKAVYSP